MTNDIDRYIIEAMRIRRSVLVYSELFGSSESISQLIKYASRAFSVIQQSMHDEIVMSLSRLFDTDCYNYKGKKLEYLSQRNIVLQYESYLSAKASELRNETKRLCMQIEIKNYRDLKVSHNDKPTLLNSNNLIKHGITSDKVFTLLDSSIQLMICLKASILGLDEVSIPVDLNEKYECVGVKLIQLLGKI